MNEGKGEGNISIRTDFESGMTACTEAPLWRAVYSGHPPWEYVKRSGLYGRGERKIFALGCGKVLCDTLSMLTFSNQADIIVGDSLVQSFVTDVLDSCGFWENMPSFLSRAFGMGGGVVRSCISGGEVCIDFIGADSFLPLGQDKGRINSGIFRSAVVKDGKPLTLYERHTAVNGGTVISRELYGDNGSCQLELSVIGLSERDELIGTAPMFSYFRPVLPDPSEGSLCGISVLDGCMDTLRAIDTVFDSFIREFILGRKRIIVPSSCIRTVVDPDSGRVSRYFDADDEVYQALKCDEEQDLKIIDNTTELRVKEHTEAINTLLDLLCFQTGLSEGTLSFSSAGVKTAAEIRSMKERTEMTMQQDRALCAEFLEGVVRSIISCGIICGKLPDTAPDIRISFIDTETTDRGEIIDRNIKLVRAGLRSELAAVMNINDCTEEEAEKELERIRKESRREVDI